MYVLSDSARNQLALFNQSLPFAEALDQSNRWIRLSELVDWQKLELAYAKTFSHTGRPGLSGRMVIGALIVKHKLQISDEEALQQIIENAYLQYFVGLERFTITPPFDSSTLTRVRKRLGEETFEAFEAMLIHELVTHKLIRPRSIQVDATAFESEITYPTDTGVLNKAREFCVEQIKVLSKVVGKKVRTYCRVAKQEYLSFNKKRRKTKKQVRVMTKHLLQYLRRNLAQVNELVEQMQGAGHQVSEIVLKTLETVRTIYAQQKEMYDERKHSVKNRIVSLHKAYIRPIVRGKSGKDVEFGAKANLSYVDGYMFADHISFDNFNESQYLQHSIERFERRFGKLPDYACIDQIYGTRENRAYLKEQGIRTTVKPLGRRKSAPSSDPEQRWRRRKQKERNRIEGGIGHSKQNYHLDNVRAKLPETERSWIQMGLFTRNLMIANARS